MLDFLNNEKMLAAYNLVCNTNQNVFITGKAGTGKTTFLRHLIKNCNKNIVVVAPTGIAAINAGGTTIHSQFGVPFGPFKPNIVGSTTYPGFDDYALKPEKIETIKKMEVLVIDEVSMVRADLLDAINDILCLHRRCSHLPFGGVQLVMIGDLYQLSPVVKKEDEEILNGIYKSFYFFDSWALNMTQLELIEFDHIYRQNDQTFIDILNEIRRGSISEESYNILKSKFDPRYKSDEPNVITVCTHNKIVQNINNDRLNEIETDEHSYECSVEGDFNKNQFPCDQTLTVKIGSQVMFLTNDPKGYYCNGTIGIVNEIYKNPEKPSEEIIQVELESGKHISVEKYTWDNFKFENDENGKIARKSIGKCTQYPLRLAWAITVHKSQGLTFDKVILDISRSFAPGQIYVALSRCRTLENLHLISMFSRNAVSTDRKITRFFRNKRANQVEV